MNAFVIDAFEFSRINGSREGVTPVAEMTRLTKDCADNSGTLAWQVVGGTGKMGFPELTLSVSGTVQLDRAGYRQGQFRETHLAGAADDLPGQRAGIIRAILRQPGHFSDRRDALAAPVDATEFKSVDHKSIHW